MTNITEQESTTTADKITNVTEVITPKETTTSNLQVTREITINDMEISLTTMKSTIETTSNIETSAEVFTTANRNMKTMPGDTTLTTQSTTVELLSTATSKTEF
jgi:hypothetical protein